MAEGNKSFSDFKVGQVVGNRYDLLEEIGRGGYAIVFRAIDREQDQEVALKTIRPVARPKEALARVRREAALISRLQHENTVRIFDYGMEGDVYIAMELLKGHPLSDELDTRRKLPVARAIQICCEVLKSLAEAHDHGIVHRDLKPENVFLVGNSDGTESVKVLDFGIAKLTKDATHLDPMALTLQGRAMGTPNYMSPEQAKGLDLTAHSDLYTMGILLFEMITGKPPFAGGTAMDIMLRHVNAPVPRLPDPKLRGTPIERAIRKALTKDHTRRFQNAADMLAALGGSVAVPVGELPPPVKVTSDHSALTPIQQQMVAKKPFPWRRFAAWVLSITIGLGILALLFRLRG